MQPSARLRDRIRLHRRGKPRPRRYPEALRREILAYAREQRDEGVSLALVAARLGLSVYTLYEWLGATRRRAAAFRQVEVAAPQTARLVLVTPQGYRLEGDVESLGLLLRMLT